MPDKIYKPDQIALEIRKLIDLPAAIQVTTRFNPGYMMLHKQPTYIFDIMLKFKKIDMVIEINLSEEVVQISDCAKIAKIAMQKKSNVFHSVSHGKTKATFKSESLPSDLIKYFTDLYENTQKTTK